MKRLILSALLLCGLAAANLPAQNLAPSGVKPAPKSSRKNKAADPAKPRSATSALSEPEEAITTEIYADEAFFDSAKSIGIFSGHVIVKDPRFNVQSDKLTIYMAKNAKPKAGAEATPTPAPEPSASPSLEQGLEKAVAEGNVGVVREQPGENGAPPTRSIGRADTAIYTTSDGNVELRGSPRVQSGMNTHIATSPDTVMYLTQDGKLTTRGPSRTEIHQEPKTTPTPAPAPAAPPVATASPTPKP